MATNALRVIEAVAEAPRLSLDLPDSLPFEEWIGIGRQLCAGQQALNWHIGDWWAFGDHRYGDRAKLAAEGIFGREFQSLMDMASVARKFETTRRRDVLSFTHHREVASLPDEMADAILDRAESEHLSTREVRKAVAEVRAANDPDIGAIEPDREVPATPAPTLLQRELTEAYSHFIEAMEALQEFRHLKKRESNFLGVALEYLDRVNRNRRPVPDDFDIIFVEQGRLECEVWYRASRVTVDRWLIERGKRRLIEARAEFLRFQAERSHGPAPAAPVECPPDPLHSVASKAADFLRVSRYGGWTVTQNPAGGWRVGTVQKASGELIAMAERQGFDAGAARADLAANLQAGDGGEVKP